MKNPTVKDINTILDRLKTAMQDIERLKQSVFVLRALVAAQMCGKDREMLESCVKEIQHLEEQLSGPASQDIQLAFEAVKHLLRRGNPEHPDA